jgi:hypothetical protein
MLCIASSLRRENEDNEDCTYIGPVVRTWNLSLTFMGEVSLYLACNWFGEIAYHMPQSLVVHHTDIDVCAELRDDVSVCITCMSHS